MLFWKLVSVSLRSQMQYPASFLMLSLSHFLGTFVDILGIWVLFDRFQMVKGWTLHEVAIIYGIVHMGFALAEAFSRGFDTFHQLVKHGDFDRLLLRPLSPFFQVAVREAHAMRIGRFLQGLTVLLWGTHFIPINPFFILFSVLGTGALFYALFVIQAAISFWTIETLEFMNITTYGGLHTGQYPMSIYKPFFRLIFTIIIPLACVAYYPVASYLQREAIPLWLGLTLPLSGFLFLFLAFQLWRLGVRRYQSTGS